MICLCRSTVVHNMLSSRAVLSNRLVCLFVRLFLFVCIQPKVEDKCEYFRGYGRRKGKRVMKSFIKEGFHVAVYVYWE